MHFQDINRELKIDTLVNNIPVVMNAVIIPSPISPSSFNTDLISKYILHRGSKLYRPAHR